MVTTLRPRGFSRIKHRFWLAAMLTALAANSQPAPQPSAQEYIDYALSHDGDVERGRELFFNAHKTICAQCHTTDGSSGKAGPDLFAVGDKFARRDMIRAVLEPSADIAIGYGTTIIEEASGEEVQGVIKEVTGDWIELMSGDGRRVRIATKDIKSQRASSVSLMPQGLERGLALEEFANLIAYLGNLRQPLGDLMVKGMPARIPMASRGIAFEPFFHDDTHFDHPTWFGEVPGGTNTFVVLEVSGHGWLVKKGATADKKSLLADVSNEVYVGGGSGLLGMAFHPKFRQNRKYYLKYQSMTGGRLATLLVERTFAEDFSGDSGAPARVIMKISASTQDHTGGNIVFGPDGFLYLGMGDTGPQRDPQGHAQNLALLQGKMLRIDVDHQEDGLAYAIPANNPFRGQTNARPEIWAYGLREPWRFSFDSLTHDLWVGDVGQDSIEEVDILRSGENYGWNVYEGFTPFSDQYRRPGEQYTAPVFSYTHRTGVSITGGYVYRGHRAPAMQGRYICADFELRHVWALTQTNRLLQDIVEIGRAPTRAVSFAQDHEGELYLVGFDSGVIFHLGLENADLTPLETRVIAATAEAGPVEWRFAMQKAEGWNKPGFDDSPWTRAPAGFGTRDTPGAIIRSDWHADDIWLRREFEFPTNAAPGKTRSYVLRIHHDDDAEVFINGVEAARLPQWTTGYIEVPLTAQAVASLHPGENLLAVHCHQTGGGQYIDAGLVELSAPPDAPK